jgi:hypothetical protein
MYIKITEGLPEAYSIEQLRRDNPQTSFPKTPSEELLARWSVYRVQDAVTPGYDVRTHYLKASDFYQVEGEWRYHYSVEKLPQAQVEQTIRAERDRLLAESDWIVTRAIENDTAVPDEWKDYRQKLRDLPSQQGFPYEVIWPTLLN